MITVEGLHKEFNGFHALKGVDMHVKKGEIYGFIGHNGAGKSTTMNILAGLSHPSEGTCIVNGQNIAQIKHPGDLHIGYLPEDPQFYAWMSAYETLAYLGSGVAPKQIHDILAWVGLTDSAHRRVGGFSRGMRQRLGIGAALIRDPDLLILDEPSSALDPEGRSYVLHLITQTKQMGKTVIFSSHILSDVERICDTVGMIAGGSMVMEKSLLELQRENIRPVFDITLMSTGSADTLSQLHELPGVTGVTSTGSSISVTVVDETEAAKTLMRFFVERDIPLRNLSLRQIELEEVFMQGVRSQ